MISPCSGVRTKLRLLTGTRVSRDLIWGYQPSNSRFLAPPGRRLGSGDIRGQGDLAGVVCDDGHRHRLRPGLVEGSVRGPRSGGGASGRTPIPPGGQLAGEDARLAGADRDHLVLAAGELYGSRDRVWARLLTVGTNRPAVDHEPAGDGAGCVVWSQAAAHVAGSSMAARPMTACIRFMVRSPRLLRPRLDGAAGITVPAKRQ